MHLPSDTYNIDNIGGWKCPMCEKELKSDNDSILLHYISHDEEDLAKALLKVENEYEDYVLEQMEY